MLTDEQLDELTTRLLKKIAPMLGLEYEEPESQPVTTIEDENGIVHDLAKLVNTQCLIDTGMGTFMAVQDYTDLKADPYWMAWDGQKYTPEELAERINLMAPGNSDIVINVHELRD
jgi:hypothetical protein